MAKFAVNSAVQESTQKSPFELNYGFLPRTPTSFGVSAVPAANALRMPHSLASFRSCSWKQRLVLCVLLPSG